METKIYWINGPWPGRLAIIPRPRGGDWLREEMAAWKQSDIHVVVSVLTHPEEIDLDLLEEKQICRENGLEFFSFPIEDRGVPFSRQALFDLLRQLTSRLQQGRNIAIHCRQGIGRSSMVAASLLMLSGFDPDKAFHLVEAARGRPVPDTSEQREWVRGWAQGFATEK